MAKNKKPKAKTKAKPNKTSEDFSEHLPQNIVQIGERVEQDKNIYISQSVYNEIHRFTKDKTVNEAGGILLGNVIKEFGKTNIIITAFLAGKHCQATPTTLTFTHETWEDWHKEIEKKYADKKIIGWIHTHPDFGIFLSEYDKFIQENFFAEDYETAYVIDPIRNIEGFYFWINGKIEKCNGFYIFDKTGKKISVENTSQNEESQKEVVKKNPKQTAIIGILCALVIALVVALIVTVNKVNSLEGELKKTQDALASGQTGQNVSVGIGVDAQGNYYFVGPDGTIIQPIEIPEGIVPALSTEPTTENQGK